MNVHLTVTGAIFMAGTADPSYAKWVKTYLIVVISLAWIVSIVASIGGTYKIPPWTHLIMGAVIGSLFKVEFSGIKLFTKDNTNDSK